MTDKVSYDKSPSYFFFSLQVYKNVKMNKIQKKFETFKIRSKYIINLTEIFQFSIFCRCKITLQNLV